MAAKKITIDGQIIAALPDAVVKDLTVELRDQSQQIERPVATTQTNIQGHFRFQLNPHTLKRRFKGVTPEVFLVVKKNDRLLLSTLDEQVIKLGKNISGLKIVLPKDASAGLVEQKRNLPKVDITKLLAVSGVKSADLPGVVSKMKRQGLSDASAILSRLDRVTKGRTGLEPETLGRFKAMMKFSAAAGSHSLGAKLVDKGIASFSDVGALSKSALMARVGKINPSERGALDILYRKAVNVHNDVLNQTAFAARLSGRDGLWLLDKKKYADIDPDDQCGCEMCQNAFGPYAYLINLLDMIHYQWQLPTSDLEKILLQNIDDLDCQKSHTPLLQIELAVEVLEKYKGIDLPLSDSELSRSVERVWVALLFGEDSDTHLQRFRKLGQHGSNPLKKLIQMLQTPGAGIDAIRKGYDLLKSGPRIGGLKAESTLYAEAGEQFEAAVDRAYGEVLVLYRAALVKSIKPTIEQLQATLFIDLKAGPCHLTNRLTFLILSLQAFITSVRTGRITTFARPDIAAGFRNRIRGLNAIPVEEASWKWLKDYSSWASAMVVFLYPENVTIPFFGENFHGAFRGQREVLVGSLDVNTDAVKKAYMDMIGNLINGDLTRLSDHSGPDVFFYPESGLIYDLVFFPTGRTHQENTSTALSFIQAVNGNPPLDTWLAAIDTYMAYLGQDELLETHLFMEMRLHFPLMAAWVLNRSEHFAAAHDWYRQLYDPNKTGRSRFGFPFDTHFSGDLVLGEAWHEGVLDPDEIARHREGVMKRHVIFMMVRNLLDWADHEFALATVSSLDRARQLYELAGKVLDSPDLADDCHQSVRELTLEIVTRYGLDPAGLVGTLVGIIEDLNQIEDPELIRAAVDDIRTTLPEAGNIDPSPIEKIVNKAGKQYLSRRKTQRLADQVSARHKALVSVEDRLLQQTAGQANDGLSPYFFSAGGINALDANLAIVDTGARVYTNAFAFCVPPNPLLVALHNYIELSLLKFQLCLDISGDPLPAVVIDEGSVAQFFDVVDARVERRPLLDSPADWFNAPPRYRYSYLVEKARQFTDVAQRIGSALLAAREKYDNEKLAILNAQHAIELASSTIDLRNLGLKDAVTGLELANLQSDRASAQLDFWQERIDSGPLSEREQQAILFSQIGIGFQATAAAIQYLMVGPAMLGVLGGGAASIIGAGTAIAGIASGGTVSLAGIGAIAGGAGTIAASLATGGQAFAGALQTTAGALSSFAGLEFTVAGLDRRFEDWTLQRDLSDFDMRISAVQTDAANNRLDVASQELSIAKLQNTQAKEVLNFLENKFSNEHLYEWMVQVLSQNYRTLLQIASSVARQAQRALEFERQEKINVIVGDYWSVNTTNAFSGNLSEDQKNSGILGAERLLTDLTRLDAYKIGTEKRRLQLSKSISMAKMLPGELAALKATGEITFNTLMRWFDRDFPGHYLRLIKNVRVSMLALTPPTDGIHASLSNGGESSVVVPDESGGFKTVRAFRDFSETIAIDSPFNETGLFVLNYDDPLFLPFEGLGVETKWTLTLPRASNRFNFDTLADVILTIEYTAFASDSYAMTVKSELGNTDVNDLPVSLRPYFPDEWYHFKNDAARADGTRRVDISIPVQFFPPQYEKDQGISTIHATVILAGNFDGLDAGQRTQLLESVRIEHLYTKDGAQGHLTLTSASPPQSGETAFLLKQIEARDSAFALFSTRDQNNSSLRLAAGIPPQGDWHISVSDMALSDNTTLVDRLTDIILVITTEGTVNWGS